MRLKTGFASVWSLTDSLNLTIVSLSYVSLLMLLALNTLLSTIVRLATLIFLFLTEAHLPDQILVAFLMGNACAVVRTFNSIIIRQRLLIWQIPIEFLTVLLMRILCSRSGVGPMRSSCRSMTRVSGGSWGGSGDRSWSGRWVGN